PTDMADVPGMGFPQNFVVSAGPNTGEDIAIFDRENRFFTNPEGNPVIFDARGTGVRYIQVRANRLWRRGQIANFALAELQAYSDGENVALGASVEASDSFIDQEFPRWAPEFLVDGYSSQYKLAEFPEYLDLLEKRRGATLKRLQLLEARNHKTTEVLTATAAMSTAVFIVLLAIAITALIRQRRVRFAETTRLRTQIARDLHDDIGSNLGSIALTSQIAGGAPDLDEQARQDFDEIHAVAERTAESMRDIVWLIDTGNRTFEDLITKMRDAANRLLFEIDFQFTHDLSYFSEQIVSLRFRRHCFFGFKEMLNNIRKHAGATEVGIEVKIDDGQFQICVEDNGKGFNPEERRPGGRGISNIGDRAERLGGTCEIVSQPDRGTVVSFQVPLKSSREH
ncbi:MAG: hypothetical protein HKN23_02310, partial [Verrucomicrobiales bacterium]|nr:hypothetical protein [Verrucomicrobiales bacterium]